MKQIILIIALCGLVSSGFAIVPGYYGARALSLGYASTAFNYDINSIFINPSNLSSMSYSLSGYQYQNNFLDYKDFSQDLKSVLEYDLNHFQTLPRLDKESAFSLLQTVFDAKVGMYGFSANIPGFIAENYGISVSFVNTAVINPIAPEGSDFFQRPVEEISNADIASLQMNFLGLKYTQFSLSYSMELYQSVTMGISLHYLTGKITEFNRSIVEDAFNTGTDTKEYLEDTWKQADEKFSKIVADIGFNATLGRYFRLGLVFRNFGAAKINSPLRTIALPRRVIAGLAFRPDPQWGFYVDMDIKKTDLLFNGQEMQPFSFGIEKGFFKNQFMVRAGMLNDLTEKNVLGKKANALYGFGVGFNMNKFVVDLAIGLNGEGSVKSLAISGFIMVK